MKLETLERSFYAQDTVVVAKNLLGKYLVHVFEEHQYIAKIVEVEAYLGPHDLAAHSAKGRTKRTEVMFGPPGYAYVYLIYGMYHCMNVVTEEEGKAAAVLIRALEPISNNIHGSTKGPGLLCKAMKIDRSHNAHNLCSQNLYIASKGDELSYQICKRPRIGVQYAGEWANKLLRFYIKDNPFVSKA